MKKRAAAGVLAAVLALTLVSCTGVTASTIQLMRTEGKVRVYQDDGRQVEPEERLMLYSGYNVSTGEESYAWIDLDEVKLAKMDRDSRIEIQKKDQDLEVLVSAGGLFFNITQPLSDDETLTIRTSTLAVGIRGTCGWVRVDDEEHMAVYIVEGTVECTVTDPDSGETVTESVTAGEMALLTLDPEGERGERCAIRKEDFTRADVPAFVEAELDGPLAESLPGGDAVLASGSYNDTSWTLSGEGVLTISGTGDMEDFPYNVKPRWMAGGLPEIRSVVIESGVTGIGSLSFAGCTALTGVTISDTVTSIGWEAFRGCTALTSLVLPDHVTKIERSAFEGCTALVRVDLPSGLSQMESGCFRFCERLSDLTLPDGLTGIGNFAFLGCAALTDVTIPGSVTAVGEQAFMDCTALERLTIQNGVTELGTNCFLHCESLRSVTIPGSVTAKGTAVFSQCSALKEVVIQEGVTAIGAQWFITCPELTSVTLPASLTEIGRAAFTGCTSLTDVYYAGTQEQFDAIQLGNGESTFNHAAVHFGG